ncbi:flagellar hook-basal body complex protein [Dickeya chrysanthemi]|uniref:flagellar hook-basal body complex protein n=1 Tax=Dickeya chrysanthemi TaxID=556 RepID=UPI003DA6FF1F
MPGRPRGHRYRPARPRLAATAPVQQTRMSVISNNLANTNTTGFKRDRAAFEDLLYQQVRAPGGSTSAQTQLPTGLQLGTGVRVVSTFKGFDQGSQQQTGRALDVMVNGRGFFEVHSAAGSAWIRRFRHAQQGFASGWMRIRGNRRRRNYDRGFVVSDHADWPDLLRTIEETGARRVIATHGNTDALIQHLLERGVAAEAFRTDFGARLRQPRHAAQAAAGHRRRSCLVAGAAAGPDQAHWPGVVPDLEDRQGPRGRLSRATGRCAAEELAQHRLAVGRCPAVHRDCCAACVIYRPSAAPAMPNGTHWIPSACNWPCAPTTAN